MFLHPTEMHVQLMQVLKQGAQRGALGHLSKGVHILGEALATIAILAIGARDIGVGVVDVARKQYARVHLAPVGTHLLAVFAAGVEVGDLVGAKHVVHILGELGLEGGHHRELLAHEYLGEQLMRGGTPAYSTPDGRSPWRGVHWYRAELWYERTRAHRAGW